MFEPEPEPYFKMDQEWEEWQEWRGKEEYVQPREAEVRDWCEHYERPKARQEAMQAEPMQAEPMQAEPGRAIVCSMFCMSPHSDFHHVSRGVGRVFNVMRVPLLCFRSRL